MTNNSPNRLNSTDSPTSAHWSISLKKPGFILIFWHIFKTLPMFCQAASLTNGWFTLVWVLGSHGAEVYLEEDKTLGFMDWWPVTSALCAANTNLATPQQPQINGISWGDTTLIPAKRQWRKKRLKHPEINLNSTTLINVEIRDPGAPSNKWGTLPFKRKQWQKIDTNNLKSMGS